MIWPADSDGLIPNSYGTLSVSPTVIPEFPEMAVPAVLFITLLVTLYVRKKLPGARSSESEYQII